MFINRIGNIKLSIALTNCLRCLDELIFARKVSAQCDLIGLRIEWLSGEMIFKYQYGTHSDHREPVSHSTRPTLSGGHQASQQFVGIPRKIANLR